MCNTTGLVDEQQKVRTISALAIAALAEAATPYGIESFDSVLKPLWKGIRQHRGKVTNQLKKLSIFLLFFCLFVFPALGMYLCMGIGLNFRHLNFMPLFMVKSVSPLTLQS